MTEFRGSRMHVLDWVEDPQFHNQLLELVQPVACTHDSSWKHLPRGHTDAREARLESFGPEALPEHAEVFERLRSWWLQHGGNTPNWDIAARANIEGKPGLILVEAKANHPELDNGPKSPFRLSASQAQRMTPAEQDASAARSKQNDARIDEAFAGANRALAAQFPGIRLSRDADYQLSNRVAFAWWLASQGIPVILVYLGFTGDHAFGDAKLQDRADWETAFRAHLGTIGSPDFLERRIETGTARMWILVRAREVKNVSPSATSRARAADA